MGRATRVRRRRVEGPPEPGAALRSAVHAGDGSDGSERSDAGELRVRLPDIRAAVRGCVADAGRWGDSGGVWTAFRRNLSANAVAGPVGSAAFPESGGPGAGFDPRAPYGFGSRTRGAA